MSAQIARKVVESFKREHPPADTASSLTDRETEILDLLSKGKRNKEIADLLFISPSTVHTHIHNIYEKLQIRSRSEAILRHLQR